jgi:hypothetical protein
MNIFETAKLKNISVNSHNGGWRVMFGDNLLFDTTTISNIERFIGGCELVERGDVVGLRVNGFVHFWIEKA